MKKTEVTKTRIKRLIEEKCGGNQQRFADKCDISKHSVIYFTITQKKTPEGANPSGVSHLMILLCNPLVDVSLQSLPCERAEHAVNLKSCVNLRIQHPLESLDRQLAKLAVYH